jgi:hypothetical protein
MVQLHRGRDEVLQRILKAEGIEPPSPVQAQVASLDGLHDLQELLVIVAAEDVAEVRGNGCHGVSATGNRRAADPE